MDGWRVMVGVDIALVVGSGERGRKQTQLSSFKRFKVCIGVMDALFGI